MMRSYVKPLVFVLSLTPLAVLAVRLFLNALGANPIEAITNQTGLWTLRFLLLALIATPLKRATGWGWPIRLRRMLGLFSFFYVTLHLSSYVWLDQFFDWGEIGRDIMKRPFITVGMLAFTLLVPLAATSTNAMVRRLGRSWKKLHRLAYLIPALGVVHFWWLVKADTREPFVYACLLAVLLLLRTPPMQVVTARVSGLLSGVARRRALQDV